MDQLQSRRAQTQSPLTKRATVPRGPIGGRFVAHGLVPATFQVMPNPRKTKIEASTVPSGPRGQAVRLSKSKRLEEYQARERPTGFTAGKKCSWCFRPFMDQPLYSYHRSICESRPGGPIPTGPGSFTGGNSAPVECVCEDCGAVFQAKSERRRHIREALCPANKRPSMCKKCGLWFEMVTDRMTHQNHCCAAGAD